MTIKPATPSTRPANSIPSLIGSDVTIKGNITTPGEIQLDGAVEGDIQSASLTVGEHGSVQGIITAEEVVIKGSVSGQIKGRNIRLEKTARVKGDLFHETLSVEAGAFIEGNLTHKNNGSAATPPDSKASGTKAAQKQK